MNTNLALLSLLSALLAFDQAMAAEKTVSLQDESMICGPDPHIIKSSLAAVAGGKILNGPMEVPGGQWTAAAQDKQDAFFSLVSNSK